MVEYKVEGKRATVPAGSLLRLSPDQARRRRHLITVVDGDIYRVNDAKGSGNPVIFKNGEIFGYEGPEPNKAQLRVMVPVKKTEEVVGREEDGTGESDGGGKDVSELSKKELKAELDSLGIEYHKKDNKAALVLMVMSAYAGDPED
jgi:hypothetical protein